MGYNFACFRMAFLVHVPAGLLEGFPTGKGKGPGKFFP